MAFALAALVWLPVSAHCQWESFSGLEFLQCRVESPAPHTPAKDCADCCAVEKAHYRFEQFPQVVPTPPLFPFSLTGILASETELSPQVSSLELTAAPPDLPQRWQFLARMAPPVRAPSLVS